MLEKIAAVWLGILESSAIAAASLAARSSAKKRLSVVEGPQKDLLIYGDAARASPPLGRIDLTDAGTRPEVVRLLRRSRVMLELDPKKFVFRTIDLPRRAGEFIGPIVRQQIDRLTPWSADQALFGWSQPKPVDNTDQIALTVGATDKAFVAPLLARLESLGAGIVEVRVPAGAGVAGIDPIVISSSAAAGFAVAFWRRWIGLVSLVVVVLVVGSSLYAQYEVGQLQAEQQDLLDLSAAQRAAVARIANAKDPTAVARRMMDQRRRETPFLTLVIEAVTRILPDDSYVLHFEVVGSRLRIVGLTSDAPTLIRLIEDSKLFTNANFFAPTTRLPEDPADRFSIEATIRPGIGLTP